MKLMEAPSHRPNRKAPGTRSAFTFLELIVVIALLALLAAVLFPSRAHAQTTTRKTT